MKRLKSENWEVRDLLRRSVVLTEEAVIDRFLLGIRDHLIDMIDQYDELEVIVNFTGRDEE